MGRHPIAGIAAGFGGVAAIFMANLIPTPTDAMLFEITNESHGLIGQAPISITADYFFQVVSALLMTIVVGFVTVKVVEPRLGKYDPAQAGEAGPRRPRKSIRSSTLAACERAGLALLAVLAVVLLVHPAAGRAAARSANGRHHRPDALHAKPAVHHDAVLLDPRHGLWRGDRQVQAAPTT